MDKVDIHIYASLAFILLITSCTVKEERRDCPCILTIDLTECRSADPEKEMSIIISEKYGISGEKLMAKQGKSKLSRYVTKGYVNVSAIVGNRNSKIDGTDLTIPEGEDADSIYIHSNTIIATGETASDTIRLNKEYSAMTIVPIGGDGCGYPFAVEIVGNVGGLSLLKARPTQGNFRFRPEMRKDGTFTANIPRQLDNSLSIMLYGKETGILITEVKIGKYMEEIGFDWNKADLDDIYIDLDYSSMKVNVSIKEWDKGNTSEMII